MSGSRGGVTFVSIPQKGKLICFVSNEYIFYIHIHNTIIIHSLSRSSHEALVYKRVPRAERLDCHTTVHVSVFLDFFAPAVRLITGH